MRRREDVVGGLVRVCMLYEQRVTRTGLADPNLCTFDHALLEIGQPGEGSGCEIDGGFGATGAKVYHFY